jgi:DNA-binding transcriptional LysR family regulator
MEPHQLRHFLAAAQHGSLRTAAAAAGVSQPALTKSIRRLEAGLGVALFERHSRGVRLSPFGVALEPHAHALAAELSHAAETIRELRTTARGLVRVGAGPSMGAGLLPAVAVRLLQRGGIQLSIRSGLNDSLLLALQQGELDFAITTMPTRPHSPMVMHERLFSDRVVVVGRQGHPLAAGGATIADLAKARWIMPNRHVLTRARLAELFDEHGFGEPDIWIETDSFPFMLEVIARADLLSYMPEQLIAGHRLVAIPLPGLVWRRSVGVSYWRRRAVTPASQMFLAALRDVSQEMHGR